MAEPARDATSKHSPTPARPCRTPSSPTWGEREAIRAVSAELMIFYRVDHDRIVAHWMQFDGASLMSQLQARAAV